MTERHDTTDDAAIMGEDPSEAGIDPGLRAETATDPEVAAMVRALRDGPDTDPSDIRADISEASETIGTGSDR